MSSEEAEKESTNNDSDDETHVTGSMVETSRIKKAKKCDFVTEDGTHIHLTEEQINQQKKIEEKAKVEAAKHESEDPLDKLNDLANKKRKHANDIHDYFKANKRLKSSIQYEDHLPGTVLNKPILGMIIFNSYHRQDFVTIEDLKDLSNTMLYTVQEIFFRCHQGPELDDYARTFSSLMLAEVDKRNLNLLNPYYPETTTPIDRAQDSQVITPFHDDPYALVRQAYTEFEPFEETQPLSPKATPLLPDYTLTSPDYTLDTLYTDEESESIKAFETRTASPLDSTSPLSLDHLLPT
nr:hypothetical protein [Tanacetum cinerariifolium]